MQIVVSVKVSGVRAPAWPLGWPVPPVGSRVVLYGPNAELEVVDVVWLPQGSDGDTRAHVHVLLGPPTGMPH